MATQGRKNRIGALHGPYGNEWLNCCHPAMLASLRGANVNVQVPYRLPFDCQRCGSDLSAAQRREIVRAAQRAQDAQTGYCADYCAKSQPMAFHEIKEMQKGQQRLQQSMQKEPVEKIGQRTATRFLSDAYCKGIVRGQVECCNLRAYQKGSCVVAAERISTAAFCSFPGRALLQAVNVAFDEEAVGHSGSRYVWGKKGPGGRQSLREVSPAQAYGHRPSRPDIWCLSPYEFTTTWELEPLRIPQSHNEWKQVRATQSDVKLTARGAAKFGTAGAENCKVRLLPGVDFKRAGGAESRNKAYYPSSAGNALCHAWCLRRKARPQCPHMANAPVPNRAGEDTESNAMMTMTYFRAWTLDKKRGGDQVPYVKHLREPVTTWDRSLRRWLLQLPCAETKQYVGNFLSVYRVRPESELDNSDSEDDNEDNEELVATEELLGAACQTHVAVEEGNKKESKWSKHRSLLVDALQRAEQHWGGRSASENGPGEVGNPYATMDTKGIVKGLRRAAEAPSGNATQRNLEPSATRRPGRLQETLAAIDRWSSSVADGKCRTVSARRGTGQSRAGGRRRCQSAATALGGARGPRHGKIAHVEIDPSGAVRRHRRWTHGSQYHVVTLQAVMAKELDGDTIHHAMGLNWQGASDDKISGSKFLDLSAKAVQWRWLIIDEISMVSAELLARMDLRCRELVRDLQQSKYAPGSAHAQPFGGLNVLVAGDLWQLPPPRGTFLGEVPWEMLTKGSSKKVAHAVHGQKLVWGSQAENSMIHGITELEQCERTRDTWLQRLQQQIREGALSADNHAFLHGHDTGVPGSWSGEKLDCENAACQQLLQSKVAPARIRRLECEQCQQERASKKRVLDGNMRGDEERKLEQAKAVFATNAVKYHVNKLRALDWARKHGQEVKYAIAKDTISSRALQEKPDLGKEKLTWLQTSRSGLRRAVRGFAFVHRHACHGNRSLGSPQRHTEGMSRHSCWMELARSSRHSSREYDTDLEPAPNLCLCPVPDQVRVASAGAGHGERVSGDSPTSSVAPGQGKKAALAAGGATAIPVWVAVKGDFVSPSYSATDSTQQTEPASLSGQLNL